MTLPNSINRTDPQVIAAAERIRRILMNQPAHHAYTHSGTSSPVQSVNRLIGDLRCFCAIEGICPPAYVDNV